MQVAAGFVPVRAQELAAGDFCFFEHRGHLAFALAVQNEHEGGPNMLAVLVGAQSENLRCARRPYAFAGETVMKVEDPIVSVLPSALVLGGNRGDPPPGHLYLVDGQLALSVAVQDHFNDINFYSINDGSYLGGDYYQRQNFSKWEVGQIGLDRKFKTVFEFPGY